MCVTAWSGSPRFVFYLLLFPAVSFSFYMFLSFVYLSYLLLLIKAKSSHEWKHFYYSEKRKKEKSELYYNILIYGVIFRLRKMQNISAIKCKNHN